MDIKSAYERFRESRANLWSQRILRFIQFVSPVISALNHITLFGLAKRMILKESSPRLLQIVV